MRVIPQPHRDPEGCRRRELRADTRTNTRAHRRKRVWQDGDRPSHLAAGPGSWETKRGTHRVPPSRRVNRPREPRSNRGRHTPCPRAGDRDDLPRTYCHAVSGAHHFCATLRGPPASPGCHPAGGGGVGCGAARPGRVDQSTATTAGLSTPALRRDVSEGRDRARPVRPTAGANRRRTDDRLGPARPGTDRRCDSTVADRPWNGRIVHPHTTCAWSVRLATTSR